MSDAEWIAKLCRHGLIEPSFVPRTDFRELRDLTRLRKKMIHNLTAEKNQIQKVLECSNIKLGTVISDIFGVSGRNLLNRLLEQGYIDENDIEHRVKGQVKKKVAAIADSIFSTLDEHQLFMIRQSWDHIIYLENAIQKLDEKIDIYLEKYKDEVEQLQTVPGVNKVAAACILAEIGTDMKLFSTSDHLAFWVEVAPGNHESTGKKKYTHKQRKSPYKKTHFVNVHGQHHDREKLHCR